MKISIFNKNKFKTVIFSLMKSYEVVVLEINNSVAHIRAIDKSHISCIYLETVTVSCDDAKYIIDLEDLYTAIKENYSSLEFVKLSNDDKYSYVHIGDYLEEHQASRVLLSELKDIEDPSLPYIEYPTEFGINIEKFRTATKFLSSTKNVGELGRVKVTCQSDGMAVYSWTNDELAFLITEYVDPKIEKKAGEGDYQYSSIYSAPELYNIIKLPISHCRLNIGDDMPITVTGELDVGFSDKIKLQYILAPRIEA